jgi:hypothetical protein
MISAYVPVPSFFPDVHKTFSEYFAFDFNWASVLTVLYLSYYIALEPVAAVCVIFCLGALTWNLMAVTVAVRSAIGPLSAYGDCGRPSRVRYYEDDLNCARWYMDRSVLWSWCS